MLPIHAQEERRRRACGWSSCSANKIVPYGLVLVALLLVDETNVMFDGAGALLHLGGALQLSKCGIVLAVIVKSNAQAAVDEEG